MEHDLDALPWATLSSAEYSYASLAIAAFAIKIATIDIVGVAYDGLKEAAKSAFQSINPTADSSASGLSETISPRQTVTALPPSFTLSPSSSTLTIPPRAEA